MKVVIMLILLFSTKLLFSQKFKFNAYDALKDEKVIDIQGSYFLDSITYIVDARKEVATRAMPIQFLVVIDDENGDYSVTELEQVSAVFYNNTKKSYTKTNGEIFRLRVDESNEEFKLFLDQLVDRKFQESEKPFYSENLKNIKPGSLDIHNYSEGFDFQLLNEENGLNALHIYTFNRSNLTLLRKESIIPKPGHESVWFKQVKYGSNELIVSYTCKQDDKRIDVTIQISDGQRNEYIFDDYSGEKVWSVIATNINNKQYIIKTFKSKESDNLDIAFFKLNEEKGVFEKLDEILLPNAVLVNEYFSDPNSKQAKTYIKNNYKSGLKKTYYFDYIAHGKDVYYFFNTQLSSSLTDILIIKTTDNKVVWTQKIRRGYVSSNNDILADKPTPLSFIPKIELENDELLIFMTDRDFFYDEKGNYISCLEDKVSALNYSVVPVKIRVNIQDGSFKRETLK